MLALSFTAPIFHFINIRLCLLYTSSHCDSCLRSEMNCDWRKGQFSFASHAHRNKVLGLILIMKDEENNNDNEKRCLYHQVEF